MSEPLTPLPTEAPLTILLVDDDPLVLATLKRALLAEGHKVIDSGDPHQALALLGQEHVDLIISDLDMPGMSGLSLLAHARRDHPAVVRILLTGAATLSSALDAINKGEVFRYLTKPWFREDLHAAIAEAAARAKEERYLANVASADMRRAGLLAAIEEAFPGVTTVDRTDGEYVVDTHSVARGLAHLDDPALWALWKA